MRYRESKGKAARHSRGDGNQDQAGQRTRSGKEEDRERKTKLEGGPQGEKWGAWRGHEELRRRLQGNLHLSFWSISGTRDRELVQNAEVPIHFVDDKHLWGEGHVHRCVALPTP